MFDKREIQLLQDAMETLAKGFGHLPDAGHGSEQLDAIGDVLQQVAVKMQDNYPYHHPLYAGQMLKPPHPVARLAYAMSMWINPNNHALDGSRASSPMEKECVDELSQMFGWSQHLGHLTSGGTMANLETLWVSGLVHPGKKVIASEQAHYTHSRITDVLKIPYSPVQSDNRGRMDIAKLRGQLETGDVGTVVATMGTTGLGSVDPLGEILELRREFDFRIHADAAYGGYFTLADSLGDEARQAFNCLDSVDSIVIDPHKHGLQPYGCGCVLFSDPAVGSFYKHGSPYTYFSSDELHLGEISLECSRAGASAVALWATHQLMPPIVGGLFASDLDASLAAAREFRDALEGSNHFFAVNDPMLDIAVYSASGSDLSDLSKRNQQIFDNAAEKDLHLALIDVPSTYLPEEYRGSEDAMVTCLRSVFMKPMQIDWIDRIMELLEESLPSG